MKCEQQDVYPIPWLKTIEQAVLLKILKTYVTGQGLEFFLVYLLA